MATGKKMEMGSVTFDCKETGQKVTVDVAVEGDQLSFNSTFDPPLDKEAPISFSPINHLFIKMMDSVANGGQNG